MASTSEHIFNFAYSGSAGGQTSASRITLLQSILDTFRCRHRGACDPSSLPHGMHQQIGRLLEALHCLIVRAKHFCPGKAQNNILPCVCWLNHRYKNSIYSTIYRLHNSMPADFEEASVSGLPLEQDQPMLFQARSNSDQPLRNTTCGWLLSVDVTSFA